MGDSRSWFGFALRCSAIPRAGSPRRPASRLVSLPLEELVTELEAYVRVSHEAPAGFIHAWMELEPYRISVPMEVDSTVVQLFLSNIRLALEVLRFRQEKTQACQPASSLQPLLGR